MLAKQTKKFKYSSEDFNWTQILHNKMLYSRSIWPVKKPGNDCLTGKENQQMPTQNDTDFGINQTRC